MGERKHTRGTAALLPGPLLTTGHQVTYQDVQRLATAKGAEGWPRHGEHGSRICRATEQEARRSKGPFHPGVQAPRPLGPGEAGVRWGMQLHPPR